MNLLTVGEWLVHGIAEIDPVVARSSARYWGRNKFELDLRRRGWN